MITPKPLKKGSTVALLCASGVLREAARQPGLEAVEAMGLKAKVYPSFDAKYGYLAGDDKARAADLNAAFADPAIEGILCSRGGYGANRILPLLDWEMIKKNPKPLFGYSDVTALIIGLNNAGIVAYHTPMPTTEWYKGLDDYTMGWLKAMLFGEKTGDYVNHPQAEPIKALVGGKAQGRLCGGNLSLLANSLGTPWEVDTRGKIIFMEEVHEPPYKVDGYLTMLRNAGKLDQCAGVIFGAFTDCQAETPENSLTLEQVFMDLVAPTGKPLVTGFTCGHCMPTSSLPMGKEFILDADNCVFKEA